MHVSRVLRRFDARMILPALVLLLCGTLLASPQKDTQDQKAKAGSAHEGDTTGATYVGAQQCQACHDETYKEFQASPHWTTTQKTHKTPDAHGCESCHGPGSLHVEGGGDKSKIFAFKGASPEHINERCLSCHQQDQERANWTRGAHGTNGVTCTSCHDPHHAKVQQALLVERTPQLCYRCHTEQKADFSKPFRHRVNEGLVQCIDCHNPHGAYITRRSLRSTASQEDVCVKCHRDKQGPFLYEHVPVKSEGCVSCHVPHGSVNPRLLRVQPVNVLCMQCHTLTTNTLSPAIPSFHNQTQKYQACTMCHPAIHGSNAVQTFEY